jgi:hypothetical protein
MNHIGNWEATASVDVLVAAGRRVTVDLQWYSGDPVYISFGVEAEVGKGIRLSRQFPVFSVRDHRAALDVYGVCASGQSAAGGFATA